MKKFKIIALILGLAIALGAATYGITSAWLTDTGSTQGTFTMGDVEYEISGSLKTGNTIVPGEELVNTAIVITNKSTVASQLRIQITYSSDSAEGVIHTNDSLLSIGLDGFTYDGNYWYYSGTTGVVDASTDTTNGVSVATIDSISYNGSKVGNNFASKSLTITITFEAKQSANVAWSDMGSINFTTGLAQ